MIGHSPGKNRLDFTFKPELEPIRRLEVLISSARNLIHEQRASTELRARNTSNLAMIFSTRLLIKKNQITMWLIRHQFWLSRIRLYSHRIEKWHCSFMSAICRSKPFKGSMKIRSKGKNNFLGKFRPRSRGLSGKCLSIKNIPIFKLRLCNKGSGSLRKRRCRWKGNGTDSEPQNKN